MEKQIDQTDLLAEVKDMSPADRALALPPLNERDPDEALSRSPTSRVHGSRSSWSSASAARPSIRSCAAGSMTMLSRARTPTSSSAT